MATDPDNQPLEKYERPVLPHERKADPAMRGASMVTAGLELAIIVVAFFFGGRWLDDQLGTEPWMLIVLTLLGVTVGMILLIRQAARVSARKKSGPGPGGAA